MNARANDDSCVYAVNFVELMMKMTKKQ